MHWEMSRNKWPGSNGKLPSENKIYKISSKLIMRFNTSSWNMNRWSSCLTPSNNGHILEKNT